jgi:dynein heavy chain
MSGGSVPEATRDQRVVYLGHYVQRTLKLKPEKWNRLFTVEEHRTAVMDFLNKPEPLVSYAVCVVRFIYALYM